jgi:hypothetical protein
MEVKPTIGCTEVTRTVAIHYCLKSPGGNYDVLGKYIKGFDGWAHVHESLWFARTNKSVATVRDEFNQLVRGGDRVIVLDVTGDGWGPTSPTRSPIGCTITWKPPSQHEVLEVQVRGPGGGLTAGAA